MKKTIFIFAAVVAALSFCCGCRTHVEVDGHSYAALTEREVRELVALARATMEKNSPRHASAAEVAVIRSTEPEIKIDYRGDCSGEAAVIWELRDRRIEVVFDGVLNDSDPFRRNIMLRVMQKHPEVLDFRPGRRAGAPAARQP